MKESESEVTQSCPTLCNPMDCSLPGSSIHGIFQARALEWGAISFSRRSSQPRDWTRVSCIVGRRFTVWATREVYLGLHGPCSRLQWLCHCGGEAVTLSTNSGVWFCPVALTLSFPVISKLLIKSCLGSSVTLTYCYRKSRFKLCVSNHVRLLKVP